MVPVPRGWCRARHRAHTTSTAARTMGASRAIVSFVFSTMSRSPTTVGVFSSLTPATNTAVMARTVSTGATM